MNKKSLYALLIILVGVMPCSVKTFASWQKTVGKTAFTCATVGTLLRVAYNYNELRELQKDNRVQHMLFGDNKLGQQVKMQNWEYQKWPTAQAVYTNREAVKRELCSAVAVGTISIFDNPVMTEPSWYDIRDRIDQDVRQLESTLSFLEHKHVVYYRFLEFITDAPGFLKDLKKVCREEGVDAYALESLTAEQFAALDKRVFEELCVVRLLRPNYAKAARIYWGLYKKYLRLKAIRKIVDDICAGNDMLYPHSTDAPQHEHVWVHNA